MTILDLVNSEIISVMRNKEMENRKETIDTLKLLKAEIISYIRDFKGDNADEIIVVKKEISKREKAMAEVLKKTKGNENDTFLNKTTFEIALLKKYLPKEYTEAELISVITSAILNTNACSKKDFKVVMTEISNDIRVNKAKASKLINDILI